jgi:hypothetical protein
VKLNPPATNPMMPRTIRSTPTIVAAFNAFLPWLGRDCRNLSGQLGGEMQTERARNAKFC